MTIRTIFAAAIIAVSFNAQANSMIERADHIVQVAQKMESVCMENIGRDGVFGINSPACEIARNAASKISDMTDTVASNTMASVAFDIWVVQDTDAMWMAEFADIFGFVWDSFAEQKEQADQVFWNVMSAGDAVIAADD